MEHYVITSDEAYCHECGEMSYEGACMDRDEEGNWLCMECSDNMSEDDEPEHS